MCKATKYAKRAILKEDINDAVEIPSPSPEVNPLKKHIKAENGQ
jgi:hypothetical protein